MNTFYAIHFLISPFKQVSEMKIRKIAGKKYKILKMVMVSRPKKTLMLIILVHCNQFLKLPLFLSTSFYVQYDYDFFKTYFHIEQGHVWICFHHTNTVNLTNKIHTSHHNIVMYISFSLFIFYFSVHAYLLTEPKGNHVKSQKCFIQLESWAIYITIPIKYN